MRKAARLARRRGDYNLTNRQIRGVVILLYQAKSKPPVATLQQRLKELNQKLQ